VLHLSDPHIIVPQSHARNRMLNLQPREQGTLLCSMDIQLLILSGCWLHFQKPYSLRLMNEIEVREKVHAPL
jgi:hypothetical protein